MNLVNIGLGNMVAGNRIVAVISPDSAPIKRLINENREASRVIDATYGRKTRAVIIMDSHHIVLSSISPETILNRCKVGDKDE